MKNNYEKSKAITIFISLFLVLFLSIGYSILSKNLNINTQVAIRVDKDIRIKSLTNKVLENGSYEIYESSYTSDSFTTNIVLPNLNSTFKIDITITNKSNKTYEIENIINDVFNNENIIYTLSNIQVGSIIEDNESKTFSATFKYKTDLTTIPNNTSLGSIIKFTFKEYIYEELTYIKDSLLLKLDGTNSPINNNWIDLNNNKIIYLTNVFYDSNNKRYDFSNTGYGTLNESIIPTTGNFTLEAYIETPNTLNDNLDQAIVSQISDIENDSGRFKFNLKGLSLITFLNKQNPSTNSSYNFVNTATINTKYLLQLVRTNDSFELYVNGSKVSSQSYLSSNTISNGPFKLGRWNNLNEQNFLGYIYAVRLYNRVLEEDELLNNYDVDINTYDSTLKSYNLYQHAVNSVVTSGDGLYFFNDKYIYKGITVNNYLRFKGNSDIYRILNFSNDGLMKLFNVSLNNLSAYDDSGHRSFSDSSYCSSASLEVEENVFYGCNIYNASTIDNKVVASDSSIKIYIDNWYNNLTSSIKNKIVSHSFETGLVLEGSTISKVKSDSSNTTYTTYVGLIGVVDIIDATLDPPLRLTGAIGIDNYLIDVTNATTGFWTMNGEKGNTYDVWAVTYGTQFGKRRASRTSQLGGSGVVAYFHAQPTFYIDGDIEVTGLGTFGNPFIVR